MCSYKSRRETVSRFTWVQNQATGYYTCFSFSIGLIYLYIHASSCIYLCIYILIFVCIYKEAARKNLCASEAV